MVNVFIPVADNCCSAVTEELVCTVPAELTLCACRDKNIREFAVLTSMVTVSEDVPLSPPRPGCRGWVKDLATSVALTAVVCVTVEGVDPILVVRFKLKSNPPDKSEFVEDK